MKRAQKVRGCKSCVQKLKDAALKVRHWLIKKLGGYTEQRVPPQVRYPPPVTLHPERMVIQMRINCEAFWETAHFDFERFAAERAKEELVFRLAKEMIEKKCVVQTCEQDFSRGLRENVYTIAACFFMPSEWMKTQLGDFIAKRQMQEGDQYGLY